MNHSALRIMSGRNKDTLPPEEDEDSFLWEFVMRDVTPLPGRNPPAGPPHKKPDAAKTPKNRADAMPFFVPVPGHTPPIQEQSRELDRRTRQKLERGQMAIDAVLDLHGHTQEQAFTTLQAFVLQASQRGLRCVLVITGKGKQGAGVLRARVPEWLESGPLRPIVLQVTPARPNHGGGGACYVFLRRKRP